MHAPVATLLGATTDTDLLADDTVELTPPDTLVTGKPSERVFKDTLLGLPEDLCLAPVIQRTEAGRRHTSPFQPAANIPPRPSVLTCLVNFLWKLYDETSSNDLSDWASLPLGLTALARGALPTEALKVFQ